MRNYRNFRDEAVAALAAPAPEPNVAMIPEHYSNPGFSLQQIFAILRAYRTHSIVIAVLILSVAIVAIKFLPKTYTATATLIVNSETKDPLAGRDFPVEMLTNYVATQTELMLSPAVLLPVVDRLKLTENKNFSAGFNGPKDALREFVEKTLSMSIQIETGRGGQLLYVSAIAKDAVLAADIANAVADVYIDQDRKRLNNPASERAQRYSEELAELRDKVAVAQEHVSAFRKENGISDIDASSAETDVKALDSLQQRLLETQNLRRSLEAKTSGQQAAADEALASTQLQNLKSQLASQQTQLAQMTGTYGPQHPKVREMNAQVTLTRQMMERETRSLSDNVSTELQRTRELEAKYARAVSDQEAKVLALRQSQDAGGKLTLELESAKSVYKHALDGYDQIMFAAVANHTNVAFISRAVPAIKAAKPNKLKLLMMAFVAAIGAGIVGPAAYELAFARRLRCRDDMERSFGIPVLAQFDSLALPASRS